MEIVKDLEFKLGFQFSKAQKLLLLERGTLEGLLTVLQGNPISVKVIKQGFVKRTFVRNVTLADSKTHEDLVEAESIVFLDRLDVEVANDLRAIAALMFRVFTLAAGRSTTRHWGRDETLEKSAEHPR